MLTEWPNILHAKIKKLSRITDKKLKAI